MKIEKACTRITDIPVFRSIEVRQNKFELSAQFEGGTYFLPLAEMTQLRNALDAALEEHAKFDTAMTSPSTSLPFMVGQKLTGEEDLPVGTAVWGGAGDVWHCLKPGLYSVDSSNSDPTWSLAGIVRTYRHAKIKSLP